MAETPHSAEIPDWLLEESMGDSHLLDALKLREEFHATLDRLNPQRDMVHAEYTAELPKLNDYIAARKGMLVPLKRMAGDDNELFQRMVLIEELRLAAENDPENRRLATQMREEAKVGLETYLATKNAGADSDNP